ncbi:hypothetical protein [Actinoallomurus sp. NPDC050550]
MLAISFVAESTSFARAAWAAGRVGDYAAGRTAGVAFFGLLLFTV